MNTKRTILLVTGIILSFSFKAASQNHEKYEVQAETGLATGIGKSAGAYFFILSPGYRINNHVALGAGVSYENYGEDHLLLDERDLLYKDTGRRPFWVPFVYGKYTFSEWGKIIPYVKGQVGYGVFNEKKIPEKYRGIFFYQPKGGVNTSIDLGCSYPLMGKTRIACAVSYHYQRLTNRYLAPPWEYSRAEDNSSVGLSIGVLF